jgi:hypothetical protein
MAATSEIILPKNFDMSKLKLSEPKMLGTGGRSIYVNYGTGRLLMQTPDMQAPFGVSKWPGENGAPDKYNMDLSFDGLDVNAPMRTFFDVLQSIDDRVVDQAMVNSQLWFKKKFATVDVVQELFTHSVRHSKDPKTGEVNTRYPPRVKLTLPLKEGKFQFQVYNAARNEVDFMDILDRCKGARVQAIIQLTSIWIVGTKFGLSWKVYQLRVSERAQLSGYAFQATGEEDDLEDAVDDDVPANTNRRSKAAAAAAMLEDTDDDDAPATVPPATAAQSIGFA